VFICAICVQKVFLKPMNEFTCNAILFDLDGTLINSIAVVERQWRNWAARHGLAAEPILHVMHGRPALETMRELLPGHSAAALATEADWLEGEEAADTDGVVEITGATDLLRSLPAERWAIATSGTIPVASARLRHVGLPLPRVLITASDVIHGKPHPEPYLRAAAGLGVAPESCIVVEDTPAGIASGRAAGMQVIAIATTYGPDRLTQANAIIHRLAQLRVITTNGSNATAGYHLTVQVGL
jgi:mannitol-1-/sugar-/sorbitol-6-phosphatase